MKGSRNLYGVNFATSMKNQDIPDYCEAGWAFATTSSLGDRMRLKFTSLHPVHDLAAQVLINCDYSGSGCEGGNPMDALTYIYTYGLPDETCMPYTGTEEHCVGVNICRSCTDDNFCEPVHDYKSYYVSNFGKVSEENDMRQEILQNGPITCRIRVNNAFQSYHGGIFASTGGSSFTHYVSVIGWGEESGIPYWIVRNSWGSYWGEQGYARIFRGNNIQGIEEQCYWGIPSIKRHAKDEDVNAMNARRNQTEGLKGKETRIMKRMMKSSSSSSSSSSLPSHSETILRNFVSCGFPTDWTVNKAIIKSPLPWTYINVTSLPSTYDIRNRGGLDLTTPNQNQHTPQFCNSCWAQATASALSDRIQVQSNGRWPLFEASAQVLVNCASGTCSGGDAGDAYRYVYYHGLPDKTCQAYEGRMKTCNGEGICMDCNEFGYCWEVDHYRVMKLYEYGEVSGAENMMAEIYARGPITCFMVMTEEFMKYESGVFVEHDHQYKGGHIVEVTGWGTTTSGQKYWIVRNNWGEYWGENGWFRINMGGSNLLIESACSWGVPYLYE